MSAFANLVVHVVGLRSDDKVRRVDTRRVVAGVHDHHAAWDRAVGFGPDHAVGEASSSGVPSGADLPVAVAVSGSLPFPALVRGCRGVERFGSFCDRTAESKRCVHVHSLRFPVAVHPAQTGCVEGALAVVPGAGHEITLHGKRY